MYYILYKILLDICVGLTIVNLKLEKHEGMVYDN